MIEKIQVKTALHKLKVNRPYTCDLNIYRGCFHDCKYCFARYSHGYMLEDHGDSRAFHQHLYIKDK